MTGRHMHAVKLKAVQTQSCCAAGEAGRGVWLEATVELCKGGVGGAIVGGWMQSGELQRKVAGDASAAWLAIEG